MVATFIAGCCTKLSKEQNVEECDATGFNSSNTVWLITKTYDLNTVPINNTRTNQILAVIFFFLSVSSFGGLSNSFKRN